MDENSGEEPVTEVLHGNKWVSLVRTTRGGIEFVYSHESRCYGHIVAVLPVRRHKDGYTEMLLHVENNPAWGWTPVLASVTGGVDAGSESPVHDAVREVREETGYLVKRGQLEFLGTCRGVKSCDTVYHLFTVDLTGLTPGEPEADSLLEASEHPEWVPFWKIAEIDDPLVSVLYARYMAWKLFGKR